MTTQEKVKALQEVIEDMKNQQAVIESRAGTIQARATDSDYYSILNEAIRWLNYSIGFEK